MSRWGRGGRRAGEGLGAASSVSGSEAQGPRKTQRGEQESQEPQQPCLPKRKGLCAQAVWGRRPKITENLKLQGEVEGGVVASNGELLLEGKEKFIWEGC